MSPPQRPYVFAPTPSSSLAGGFVGGLWFDYEAKEIIPGGENDYTLNPAQAIWLHLPGGDGEHPVSFGTAGEVIQAEVKFPSPKSSVIFALIITALWVIHHGTLPQGHTP